MQFDFIRNMKQNIYLTKKIRVVSQNKPTNNLYR